MPIARPTRRTETPPWLALMLVTVAVVTGSGCQRALARRQPSIPPTDGEPRSTRAQADPVEPLDIVTPPRELPPLPASPLVAHPAPADVRVASASTPAAEPPDRAGEAPRLDAAAEPPDRVGEAPRLDTAITRTGGAPLDPVPDPDTTAPASPKPEASGPEPASDLPIEPAPVEDAPSDSTTEKDAPSRPDEETPEGRPQAGPDRPLEDDPIPKSEPVAPSTPIDPEPVSATEPDTPVDPWREGLDRLRALAQARAGEPDDDGLWALRARVLDWLAGDLLTPEGSAAWASVLAPLAAVTGPETPDPSTLGARLAEAVDAIEAFEPLRVNELRLCRKVRGFGDVEAFDPPALGRGQPVIVYCELSGLRYEAGETGVRSRLASRIEIVRRGEARPVWTRDLGTAEDHCRHRRRDFYVNYRLKLPTTLTPGSYDLHLTQTDQVGNRSCSASLPFDIRP